MDRTDFKNFDLRIEPTGLSNVFEVSVSSDCGGDADGGFTLDELIPDSEHAAGQEVPAEGNEPLAHAAAPFGEISVIKTIPPSLGNARAFGKRLFNAVFKGNVRVALDRCIISAKSNGMPLRIRLNLTKVPGLASFPWEFLCLDPENNFFARSYNSMVRYLELNSPFDDSLLQEPPLRILVVTSNPRGTSELDMAGEVRQLKEAVGEFEKRGLIVLDVLDKPTIRAISTRLHERRKTAPYHVFHYIGHAVFDPDSQEGKLLLENEAGSVIRVSAQEIGEILSRYPTLRLVVINTCEGARMSPNDIYSGVAQTFLRSGASPTVIAMQYRIRDNTAKIFSQSFYGEVLKGEDMDTAVALARLSISYDEREKELGDDDPTEWATPVLYMRAKDSRLVDFGESAAAPKKGTGADDREPDRFDDDYQDVAKALLSGNLVPFLGLDVNLFDRQAETRPPAYAELVEHLARENRYPYNVGAPLSGVSQYAQLPDRITDLYDQLIPFFDNPEFKPTPLHEFWARAAREQIRNRTDLDPKRRRFVIVTTNYDELLERAFSESVKQFHVFSYIADGADNERGRFFRIFYENGQADDPFLSDDTSKKLTDELPVILKLPGSIKCFNARVRFAITDDQYFALLTNRELMTILPSDVIEKLRGCHHLFFGYNVSDWNTRGMLYRIWEKQRPPRKSWAVQEDLSEFGRKYWEACGVTIIDENFSRYVRELEARLPPSWRKQPADDAAITEES